MREKLQTLSVATLRELARSQGLKATGLKKSELIDLLCASSDTGSKSDNKETSSEKNTEAFSENKTERKEDAHAEAAAESRRINTADSNAASASENKAAETSDSNAVKGRQRITSDRMQMKNGRQQGQQRGRQQRYQSAQPGDNARPQIREGQSAASQDTLTSQSADGTDQEQTAVRKDIPVDAATGKPVQSGSG